MSSFADSLRERNIETWDAAVGHKFVKELWAGTVPDAVMATYLSQDYLFVDAFLALMGSAVANADTLNPRLVFSRQLGLIANDEDGYFVRALAHLKADGPASPLSGTEDFHAVMDSSCADYGSALAVLLVAEWLYLDWATPQPTPSTPSNWLYAEWIDLHRGDAFEKWVAFLKSEFDRVASTADEHTRQRMADAFTRTVNCELAFFRATCP